MLQNNLWLEMVTTETVIRFELEIISQLSKYFHASQKHELTCEKNACMHSL